MIGLLSNTAIGGVGILATAGDNPVAAAIIGGVFTLANTALVAYLTRKRRDKED